MDELQSDDLFAPTFLKLLQQAEFNRFNDDKFMKNCVRWNGDFILDDFDE